MSVSEPFATGTRNAIADIFPLSSGSTRSVAVAAPVLEGISETAAALPRRLCLGEELSISAWVEV